MRWYNNNIEVDGETFNVTGDFDNSVVEIKVNEKVFFEKSINMWAYQEIFEEDILRKFEGKIRKIESKIPDWIKSGKIK